jgi:hypothetical protein
MTSFTVNRTRHRNDRSCAASRANGRGPANRGIVNGEILCLRDTAEFPNSRRAARFFPQFGEGRRHGGRKRRTRRRLIAESFG